MSFLDNPLAHVPVQGWLILFLAITALGPARYVWHFLAHERTPRDITLPPEDLSWKSRPQLFRSLAILAGLAVAGGLIFTPQAEQFAKSDWLAPALFGAIGSYALGTVLPGWRNGEIQPLIRGFSTTYQREPQPKLYWASLAWNTVVGIALLGASMGVSHDILTPNCNDPDTEDEAVLKEALGTCTMLLATTGLDRKERADLLAARGRVRHRLGETPEAIRDYSDAIALDPQDSYSLNNRGDLHLWSENPGAAIKDFNASLALRPDNDEGYVNRGFAHLALGHRELAQKDFARIDSGASFWPAALRGRAILAFNQKRYGVAIKLATQSLAIEPNNTLALHLRADAYWQTGQEDLARDDDDSRFDLEDQRR